MYQCNKFFIHVSHPIEIGQVNNNLGELSLPSASEIMNQLEFPRNESTHLSSHFSTSHCCSPSNHLLSKKHHVVIFKKRTSLRASVNTDADRQPGCEDTSYRRQTRQPAYQWSWNSLRSCSLQSINGTTDMVPGKIHRSQSALP